MTGITHTNGMDKPNVTFSWRAPPAGTGAVEVRFAVVEVQMTYWANQLAATLQGMCMHRSTDTWWTSHIDTLHISTNVRNFAM